MRCLIVFLAILLSHEAGAQWYLFRPAPGTPRFAPAAEWIQTLRNINRRHQRDIDKLEKQNKGLEKNNPQRQKNDKEIEGAKENIDRNVRSIEQYRLQT